MITVNQLWTKKLPWLAQTIHEGLQYAFLNGDKQCTPFVYCKEFLLDAVCATVNKTKTSVFGFDYDPNIDVPVDLTQSCILLRNRQDKDFDSRIQNLTKFLNQFETTLEFNPSTLEQIENLKSVYLLKSDPKWLNSLPLVSMLTLLIRVGMVYHSGAAIKHCKRMIDLKVFPYQEKDVGHLTKAWPGILKVLETKAKCLENYYPKVNQYLIHEYGGIVSYSLGDYKKLWKNT